MKQAEINQVVIGLTTLKEPLSDRHTNKQLEKLCKAIIETFDDEDDDILRESIQPWEYRFFRGEPQISKQGWGKYYYPEDVMNNVMSEFTLELLCAAKKVRQDMLADLRHNTEALMKEISF